MGTQMLERDKGRSRLKVLVIDHMGVLKSVRKKYEELSRRKDLDIVLLTPKHWRENSQELWLGKYRDRGNYKIVAGRTTFPGNSWRGVYYTGLIKAIMVAKPDIIHIMQEPWSFFTLEAIILRNIFSPKSKVVFYTAENIYRDFTYPSPLSKLYGFVEKYVYKVVDGATPISEEATKVLKHKGFSKMIKVIPLVTDSTLFRKMDASRLKQAMGLENSFIVGYVGRLVPEKGILTLLEAVSKLKYNYKLLIIGSGYLRTTIIDKAALLGINDRVILINSTSQPELVKYYNCMSTLVLPTYETSTCREQFGRVLIEAMACQVPVIGSDCGEIPKVMGEAGLVFSQQNPDELKKALVKLIKNPALRKELAYKGYQRVLVEYTWSRYAQETYNLYKELMNNNI